MTPLQAILAAPPHPEDAYGPPHPEPVDESLPPVWVCAPAGPRPPLWATW